MLMKRTGKGAPIMAETAVADGPDTQAPVALTKWAAVSGRWKFTRKGATFEGPDSDAPAPLGIAVASSRLRNGLISTTIKLSSSENTSAGLVVGFKSLNFGYLAAQIGGYDKAYA